MTLNYINSVVTKNSTSNQAETDTLRRIIHERLDGLLMEASAPSDNNGSTLMDYCNHIISDYPIATIILLSIQCQSLSANTFHPIVKSMLYLIENVRSEQIAVVRSDLLSILKALTSNMTKLSQPGSVAYLLLKAIPEFQPTLSPNTLTPVHSLFLRVCVSSQLYDLACLKLNEFDIQEVDTTISLLTPLDCLLYFYYAGINLIGMREHDRALKYFTQAITYPGDAVSAVMIASLKKAMLVSLIVTGKQYEFPEYASSDVKKSFRSLSEYNTYERLVAAFLASNKKELEEIIIRESEYLKADNNLGLAKQVLDALYYAEIKDISYAYQKISITKMAMLAGLPSAAAVQRLLKLISTGKIRASINERSGFVCFPLKDSKNCNIGELNDIMKMSTSDTIMLTEKFHRLRNSIMTSKVYVQKSISSSITGFSHGQTSVAYGEEGALEDDMEM